MRRFVTVVLVAAAGLLLAAPAAANAAAATGGCNVPCDGGGAPIAQSHTSPPADSCMRNADCGGGATMNMGSSVFAACLVGGAVLLFGLFGRLRRAHNPFLPAGRVSAGGLFRPPRFLLSD